MLTYGFFSVGWLFCSLISVSSTDFWRVECLCIAWYEFFFNLVVVATGVPGKMYFGALGTDTYSPASLVRVICGLAERF